MKYDTVNIYDDFDNIVETCYCVNYRGIRIVFRTEPELYIHKWAIRNGFKITYTGYKDGFNKPPNRIGIMKYGIYRTIYIPPTTDNIKYYLDTYKLYYEALRELKEIKSQKDE